MSGLEVAILIVLGVVVLAIGGTAMSVYNNFVELRAGVDKAWANIDVLLVQRHDELIKLVDVVSSYSDHEKKLLTELTELRTGYRDAPDIDQKIHVENRIERRVQGLGHAWEGYPDLKASANFIQLQERVGELEEQIADRRELFNDSVTIWNVQVAQFPDLLFAGLYGAQPRALLDLPAERKADVDVRMG